jgi:hypothetical protein
MSDPDPETLEETQARLAALSASPYGPAPTVADAAPAPQGRRSTGRLLAIGLTIGLLAVGVTVAAVLVFAAVDSDVAEPVATGPWEDYPGSAFRDVDEVLASPSMESVTAQGDAFVTELRAALTARFGLRWTTLYDAELERDINGYGGESLLYAYDSGLWQGSARVDDPQARAQVEALFRELALIAGVDEPYALNDYSEGADEAVTQEQFGAATKPKQPLWTLYGDAPDSTLTLTVDVYDANLPAHSSFDGTWRFDLVPGDTLYVTIDAYAYALLAEADREQLLRLLEPFEGLTPPA